MKNKSDIKKILVTRTDKLGDVILTLPLITQLKKNYPDARIYFLVSNYVKDLIEHYEGVDDLIFVEDYESFRAKTKYFKSEKIDVVINVFPRFELALAFFISGINIRIGSGYRWYSFLYNEKIYEHRKHAIKHESDYNLNLLKPIIPNIDYNKTFYFKYNTDEISALKNKLLALDFDLSGKFIILHPSSRGSAMDLPTEKFKNLCSEILKNFTDFNVVFSGSNDDLEKTNKMLSEFNESERKRIFNLAGTLNLKELMILIDSSKLFISNSTGPIHIAGALNKNIIGFYPDKIPMNSERWRPLSENAIILKPKIPEDMNSISNEDIISSVQNILNKK